MGKITNLLFKKERERLNNEILHLNNELKKTTLKINHQQKSLEKYQKDTKQKEIIIESYKIIIDKEKLDKFKLNFDVYFDDDIQKWCVITGYCQLGGCTSAFYVFKNELEAKQKAVELTLMNRKPTNNSACAECYSEYLEMHII